MTTSYNATIEYKKRADVVLPVDVDHLMDSLAEYHPAVGSSPRGWLEITITLPAASVAQAATTALAVVTEAVRGFAISAEPLVAAVMTTEEFDARAGMQPLPELVSSAEAAELLGVSRQRVNQLVEAGQLQGEHVGRALVLPRAAVQNFAGRDRGPGRPKTHAR
ncbi:helix-turn-helix domain-containing protein [Nocardioides marmoraquaticus]